MYITQLFLIVHGKNVNINISYSVHKATVIIILLYGINFIFQSYDFIKDFSITIDMIRISSYPIQGIHY